MDQGPPSTASYFLEPTQLLHHPGLLSIVRFSTFVTPLNDHQQRLLSNTFGWSAEGNFKYCHEISITGVDSGIEPENSWPKKVTEVFDALL